jgi:hypothetical protein
MPNLLTDITEVDNPHATKQKPVKEIQNIFIPDIVNQNIPNRNGFIYLLSGAGGSGKTNCFVNLFKDRKAYRGKFHNVYYFVPESSYLSLDPKTNPFTNHDKIFHTLDVSTLESIYMELMGKKEKYIKKLEKPKKENKFVDVEEAEEDDDEEPEIEYSCVIVDDYADQLKNKDIQKMLSKFLIKSRHLCVAFIFTLQSYYYFPKLLRKMLTYITIFKPRNVEEWRSISTEILSMNQENALTLYDYIFTEKYAHLDVDTIENKFFKNFNELILKYNHDLEKA